MQVSRRRILDRVYVLTCLNPSWATGYCGALRILPTSPADAPTRCSTSTGETPAHGDDMEVGALSLSDPVAMSYSECSLTRINMCIYITIAAVYTFILLQ